jgi:hypothetical protein
MMRVDSDHRAILACAAAASINAGSRAMRPKATPAEIAFVIDAILTPVSRQLEALLPQRLPSELPSTYD